MILFLRKECLHEIMDDLMSECDLIDLTTVSRIQNQGYLVVVYFEKNGISTCIRNVSSNIGGASFSARALRDDPKLFIEKTISECFSECVVQEMLGLLKMCPNRDSMSSSFDCDVSGKGFFLTLSRTRDGFVFEILPNDERPFNPVSHANDLQTMLSHTKCDSLFEAARTFVNDVVSYDRSLVYQFQDDLSGKVVYEKIRPSLVGTIESYMGLYFPESDIPLPARQMFMIRSLRVIFDNDVDSVSVIGKEDDDTPDLSRCTLRANHPVHASYMKNMGLRSSMSIGLVVDNQLWGLMCFHAYDKPAYPRGWVTTVFESLSVPLSMRVSKIYRDDYDTRYSVFSSIVYNNLSSVDAMEFFATYSVVLLKILQCDCVCVREGDQMKSWGDASLVASRVGVESVSKDASGRDWVVGKLTDPPRGVLCMVHGDLTVVFIRQSVSSKRTWAGDPSHVKIRRPDGVLGPRSSFERHVQSGVDSLNKWATWDKKLATHVSYRIKLLVTTVKFFKDKANALLGAHENLLSFHDNQLGARESVPQGQVAYTTAPAAKRKTPVLDPTLLSHFSHELKTPLHGISSILKLMECQPDMSREARKEHLGDGLRCTVLLTQAINSVLAIAAGNESGASIERISIKAFIEQLEIEHCCNQKHIRVTNAVDKDHDSIFINHDVLRDTLGAIIHNSYANASAAVEPTHVHVSRCSTHREATMAWTKQTENYSHRNIRNSDEALSRISDTDSWFTISVQDFGCGIHSDMLDNVLAYSDATRKSSSVRNSHQGVKLDVYKCISNIIFDLNGSVGIASTVSAGTIVSLLLPARVDTVKDAPSSDVKADPGEIGAFLVVDDNAVNRKLAAKLVKVACTKALGVEPVIKQFADGRICVEEIKRMRANNENIMGVLMDYHMPVMSGKEATERIRQIEAEEGRSTIPIFGFTADSAESIKEELIGSGMDGVLPKPLSMKMLQDMCRKMITRDT
jgi:light-regulated signal transduction histidine kinase (bacteriophytochrome)